MKYIASFLKVANLTCFSGKCQFIIYDKCGADTLIMTIVPVKSGSKTIYEQKK